MLLLTSTSDIVRVVTGSSANVVCHASYVDNNSGTITPGRTNTAAITTATTTTIVGSPGSGVQRNVKGIYITNNHASASTQVTVQHYDGTNSEDLMGVTLLAGENLVMDANGHWTHHDIQGGDYQGRPAVDSYMKSGITGTVSESMPRMLCSEANLSALTSGTLYMVAVYLRAGQVVTALNWHSATTAAGTPTHQISGLFDINRALLATSSDLTSAAWSANTMKTFTLTASYTVPSDGLYYAGLMVAATTVPTMKGLTAKTASQLAGQTPILHGNSTTGLTTALPNPAAAITVGVNALWCGLT